VTHIVSSLDRYSPYLFNSDSIPFKLDGVINMTNPGGNHLSYEQIGSETVAYFLLWAFLVIAIVYAVLITTVWYGRGTALHWLMVVTLLVKGVCMALDGANISAYSTLGELTPFQMVLPRLVSKLQDILSLMLFLLLGLGWKVHRESLVMLEVRFCAGVSVLSFYLGIFEASMENTPLANVVPNAQVSRHILHALTFLCIIVAINFNVSFLENKLSKDGISLSTGLSYQHYESYKAYRWIFVFFILKPTILLFYRLSFLDAINFWDDWLYTLLDNLADGAIHVSLMYSFKPTSPLSLFKDILQEDPSNGAVTNEQVAE